MFRRQVWWHIHDPIAGASRSTFLNVEPAHSIRRNQFASSEGALRLWALLSSGMRGRLRTSRGRRMRSRLCTGRGFSAGCSLLASRRLRMSCRRRLGLTWADGFSLGFAALFSAALFSFERVAAALFSAALFSFERVAAALFSDALFSFERVAAALFSAALFSFERVAAALFSAALFSFERVAAALFSAALFSFERVAAALFSAALFSFERVCSRCLILGCLVLDSSGLLSYSR